MNTTIGMDELLLFLLKKGAHRSACRLTTSEIASATGMSQQNASRRLLIMEREGVVKRGKGGISIDDKGMAELGELRAMLDNMFSPGLSISGKIAKGLGEGKFYLSHSGYRKQMKEKLGFDPYPGTLNIRLDGAQADKRRRLLQLEPIVISGFEKRGRMFGDLFAYKADIGGIRCALIVPLRTHHGPETIEIVAGENLRTALKKKDGQKVTVDIA